MVPPISNRTVTKQRSLVLSAQPLICSACNRPLDRNRESVIYLGWGMRLDGKAGYAMALALCAVPYEELDQRDVSPCVAAALKLLDAVGIVPVPLTYDGWLAARLGETIESQQGELCNLFSQKPNPEFS
jgi:hypothetical protein